MALGGCFQGVLVHSGLFVPMCAVAGRSPSPLSFSLPRTCGKVTPGASAAPDPIPWAPFSPRSYTAASRAAAMVPVASARLLKLQDRQWPCRDHGKHRTVLGCQTWACSAPQHPTRPPPPHP